MGTVIVVGAGVSGCACAAALAEVGHDVTLINSAMDRVGLPAYGPDIVTGAGGWEEMESLLEAVPLPLRRVWLEAGLRLSGGEGVLNIDRRRVSIESKRVLERLPGLRFRQGFVVDLRLILAGEGDRPEVPEASGQPANKVDLLMNDPHGIAARPLVEVETVFGEVFSAEAVVLAVGLSLDGRTEVGGDVMEGGRYGEQSSEGLYRALSNLGAKFREVRLEVGARIHEKDAAPFVDGINEERARGATRRREMIPGTVDPALHGWPETFPPAPHWDDSLRSRTMVLAGGMLSQEAAFPRTAEPTESADPGRQGQSSLPTGVARPVVSPDGAATSELYLAPCCAASALLTGGPEGAACEEGTALPSRMPLTVRAKIVAEGSDAGSSSLQLGDSPIWVIGRAAGAGDYLESLLSGVQAANSIAAWREDR